VQSEGDERRELGIQTQQETPTQVKELNTFWRKNMKNNNNYMKIFISPINDSKLTK